ncbi:type VI secretion system baseplate subunit TssG, partial [Salmonella enterica subsp. enterica serovar Kentucky]|nr:type VI secretion system baseplate subunit TssG [Salmonella enterica subsp. enterica serovar Kentucky]
PDMQYKFRLIIGPLTLEDYLRFLPGGNNLPVLTELVRTFIGFRPGHDADLLVFSADLRIEQVYARGKRMVNEGKACVKGTFEPA